MHIYSYVCSRHFNDCCMERSLNRRKIKSGHFPSLDIQNGVTVNILKINTKLYRQSSKNPRNNITDYDFQVSVSPCSMYSSRPVEIVHALDQNPNHDRIELHSTEGINQKII